MDHIVEVGRLSIVIRLCVTSVKMENLFIYCYLGKQDSTIDFSITTVAKGERLESLLGNRVLAEYHEA